jgi:hypothetical protein
MIIQPPEYFYKENKAQLGKDTYPRTHSPHSKAAMLDFFLYTKYEEIPKRSQISNI